MYINIYIYNKVPKTDDSVGVSIYTTTYKCHRNVFKLGPGELPISHFSGHFVYLLVSGAFLDPEAPQVGTNIPPALTCLYFGPI